jgi:hypothetical protein
MMTAERWIALLVIVATVVCTLLALALLDREASSKVEVGCIDAVSRENIRAIFLRAIDRGLEEQILHVFEIWVRDPSDQPRRAKVGADNAVSAYVRARAAALVWDPPVCD